MNRIKRLPGRWLAGAGSTVGDFRSEQGTDAGTVVRFADVVPLALWSKPKPRGPQPRSDEALTHNALTHELNTVKPIPGNRPAVDERTVQSDCSPAGQ